jgi:hypothetical protein
VKRSGHALQRRDQRSVKAIAGNERTFFRSGEAFLIVRLQSTTGNCRQARTCTCLRKHFPRPMREIAQRLPFMGASDALTRLNSVVSRYAISDLEPIAMMNARGGDNCAAAL